MTFTDILPFINTIICCIFISYFFSKSLHPKNEKIAFTIFIALIFISESIILISKSLYYLSYLLIIVFVLIYYKERILQKLSALLFLMSLIFCAQTFCSILFWYIPTLINGERMYLHISQSNSNSMMYIIYFSFNIISCCVSCLLATWLWNYLYHYLNLGILCELFIYPHLICMEPVFFFSLLHTRGISFLFLLLLGLIGNLSIFHGLYRLHKVLSQTEDDIFQKKVIELQLNNYHNLEQHHLEMRKWNHDVSNHLQTIEYLLKNSEKREAQDYLASLIQTI